MANDIRTARFYRALWPLRADLLRTALFLCRNQDEAEDLAQETFIKAFRALDQLADDAGALPWLLTILRNTRIDRLRAARAHPTLSLESAQLDLPADLHLPDPADTSPASLLESLSDESLIQALRQLPEDLRWTLLLVDVHGFDHVQAAQIQNVPVGTIKSRAHRARSLLRSLLTNPFIFRNHPHAANAAARNTSPPSPASPSIPSPSVA